MEMGNDSEDVEKGSDGEEAVERAREAVLEALEASAEQYGLNRSYGRLYGILYLEDDLVSLNELVEESGYAKSTVSSAMSALQRLHLVRRRSIPGEGRKAFYEAETDFWRVAQEFLRGEVQREIDVVTHALESAESDLEGADGERAERYLEQVRRLQTVYERGELLIELITSDSVTGFEDFVDRFR